jgi:hypothetical protein
LASWLIHLLWVVGRAGYELVLVSAAQRPILKDLPSRQSTTSNILSQLWGFPPLYRFARRSTGRYVIIIALSVICAVFFSLATILPMALGDGLTELMYISLRWCADRDAACFHEHALEFLRSFTGPVEVIIVCLVAGWGAQRLLQRLLRFSLESLQEIDTRAPVLFLRAFKDDQVPLKPPRLAAFGRLLELGRRANSLDQLLLDEATPIGPVVGLGNPDDKRPPYGAARGYFDHKTWQEAVADLANNAILIVICIDDSAGIWWEVEHLVGRRHLHKTLFVLHPRYVGASENAAILQRIAERGSLALGPLGGEGESQSTIGFFQDRSGGTCVIRSSTFSRFAYLLTLRAFIRERLALLPVSLADRSRWPEQL